MRITTKSDEKPFLVTVNNIFINIEILPTNGIITYRMAAV
jgi:hypothetical protein